MSDPTQTKPLTVLIVEDEVRIRSMLQMLLTTQGYKVITADTADSGLELARQQQPDLVVTDITMPGKSGIDLIKAIRSDSSLAATRILAMTGGSLKAGAEADKAGADGFLAKPFRTATILSEVERIIGRPS